MKLYAGTTEQFRTDARAHRIAEKLQTEYVAQIGHRPAPSEVASWQNSLMALSMLVDQAKLNDHGVITELKRWSDGNVGPSTDDFSLVWRFNRWR